MASVLIPSLNQPELIEKLNKSYTTSGVLFSSSCNCSECQAARSMSSKTNLVPTLVLNNPIKSGGGAHSPTFSIMFNGRRLFYSGIVPFTGNCGAKAIEGTSSYYPSLNDKFLFFLETYIAMYWPTGIVVGSDGTKNGLYELIKNYGRNWEMLKPVQNPNYDRNHLIGVFWKDLNRQREEYAAEYKTWSNIQ